MVYQEVIPSSKVIINGMSFVSFLKDCCVRASGATLSVTADAFSVFGAIGSSLSGMAFVTSYLVDNQISIDYYARGDIVANSQANFTFSSSIGMAYHSETYPMAGHFLLGDSDSFNVNEHLSAESLRLFACVSYVGGVALSAMGSNLRLWLDRNRDGVPVIYSEARSPTIKEFGYQTLGNALQSCALTLGAGGLAGSIYHLTDASSLDYQYTIPQNDQRFNNQSIYDGPLEKSTFDFNVAESSSLSTFSGFPSATLLLKSATNATASLLYGAKLMVEGQGSTSAMAIVPLMASPLVYHSGRFFKAKAEQSRLLRQQPCQESVEECESAIEKRQDNEDLVSLQI